MQKNINKIIRIVLGLALILFGLDKFFQFLPHDHVMTEEFIAAYKGLLANKFIMPTVGVVELLSGILLVAGRWVIVALLAMIPIAFGILGFHFAVDIQGILLGAVITVMLLYLLSGHFSNIGYLIKQVDAKN
ncbi:MAG: DoxX family protein [Bacteroidota bacterium]|nr:DoxX family protein [Bacteroidota bacterium]